MSLYSALAPYDAAILRSVTLFRQMTSGQLRRLHFTTGTERSRYVYSTHVLDRMVKRGLLRRIPRTRGGAYGGSGEYVYQVAKGTAKGPDFHKLDISELYIQLVEKYTQTMHMSTASIQFDPEPWSHTRIGHQELKPDAYVDLGDYRYFIELDRGSEHASQLSQKMRRYVRAYEQMDGGTFPLCLWVVPDADRARYVLQVVRRQSEPGLFDVVLFEDAVTRLIA